jgi:phosphocarrier protein
MPHTDSETPKQTGASQCSKEFVILNELGIHARPASKFASTANRFKSDITVEKDGETVNGKSILGLMMLAAGKGTAIKITAKGADAEAAVQALEELIKHKFNES